MKNDNYINVSASKAYFNITSKNKIFENEYVKLNFFEDYFTVSVPSLDYRGKSKKTSKTNSGWRQITHAKSKLSEGKYFVDEDDSTEDELVFYYK